MGRFEEQIALLTKSIIRFEAGDIFAQTDWITEFNAMKSAWTDEETAQSLIDGLVGLIRRNMASRPAEDYIESLSRGVELLDDIDREGAISPSLQSRIGEFLRRSVPPDLACDDEAVQPEETQAADNLPVFLADAEARLSRAQELILLLEKNPADAETVNELFRIFHTIKGECGFLKIPLFAELAHNIEGLLDRLRDKKVRSDSLVTDLLLEGIDYSSRMVRDLAEGKAIRLSREELGVFAEKLTFGRRIPEDAADAVERENPVETTKTTRGAEEIVRVKAAKIENLVDMIGELITTIGQVEEHSPLYAQLRKFTRELQRTALELKTDSARNLFGKIQRSVRDLSKKLDKKITVELSGEDLEIDRDLIGRLEEPLLHIIRNAVDHGIEPSSERLASKKPAGGTVRVTAGRRGNHIEISIFDDGRGLDRERILAKAIDQGIVDAKDAGKMRDQEVYDLIFLNGFSTASSVGYVSGRGVGMNIVKETVRAAKGRIVTETESGRFTRFILLFPLNMAIVDGVVVRVGRQRYVIPVAAVVESIRLGKIRVDTVAKDIRMYRLRDEPVPVVPLSQVFGQIPDGASDIGVVVETSDKRKFVLLVDEVLAKREVVIKSLGPRFKDLRGIAAGTVVSGGGLALVLDVDETIQVHQEQGIS